MSFHAICTRGFVLCGFARNLQIFVRNSSLKCAKNRKLLVVIYKYNLYQAIFVHMHGKFWSKRIASKPLFNSILFPSLDRDSLLCHFYGNSSEPWILVYVIWQFALKLFCEILFPKFNENIYSYCYMSKLSCKMAIKIVNKMSIITEGWGDEQIILRATSEGFSF